MKAKEKKSSTPKVKRKGKWRRRLFRFSVVVIALSILARVALPFVLPPLLDKALAGLGYSAEYERLDLSLLTCDIELWHLGLARSSEDDDGDPESIVDLEYCRLDLSILELLVGNLVVRRAEVDGVDLHIVRDEEGEWRMLSPELKGDPDDDVEEAPPSEGGLPDRLLPPIAIDAMRLQHVRIDFHDRHGESPIDLRLNASVRVSNLGSKSRPMRLDLRVSSKQILDLFAVEGEAQFSDERIEGTLDIRMGGLELRPLASVLRPLGLVPTGDPLSMSCETELDVRLQESEDAKSLAMDLAVKDLSVREGTRRAFSFDELTVVVPEFDDEKLRVQTVLVRGFNGRLEKSPTGELRAVGVELHPSTSEEKPKEKKKEPSKELRLDELRLEAFAFTFQDESLPSHPRLKLLMPELVVRDLGSADRETSFDGRLEMPEAIRGIHLRGRASLFTPIKTLSVSVDGEGVAPEALKPYFEPSGLRSELKNGSFSLTLDATLRSPAEGRTALKFEMRDFGFKDEQDLFSLARIRGDGLEFSDDRIELGTIEVSGIVGQATLREDGFHAMGFTIGEPPAPADPDLDPDESNSVEPDQVGSPPDSSKSEKKAPSIHLERLTVKDNRWTLKDDSREIPLEFSLRDFGVECADLSLDAGVVQSPSTLKVWLEAPGVVEKVSVEGQVRASASDAIADLTVRADGFTLERAAPYLESAGLSRNLESGAFEATVGVKTKREGSRFEASVDVQGVRFSDGEVEHLGLDVLQVPALVAEDGHLALSEVRLSGLRGQVFREADGTWSAMGVTVRPDSEKETEPASDEVAETEPETAVAEASPEAGGSISLGEFTIEESRLSLEDRMGAASTSLTMDLRIQDVDTREDGKSSPVSLNVAVPDAIDKFSIQGHLALSKDVQGASLDIIGEGMRDGPLSAYLPKGMAIELDNGRFQTSIEARVESVPDQGRSVLFKVQGMDFRDGDQSLLTLDALTVDVPTLNMDEPKITAREISMHGLGMRARRSQSGDLHALGIILSAPEAETQPNPPPSETLEGEGQSSRSLTPTDRKLPFVQVETLDLQLADVQFIDESMGSKPLALSKLRLWNLAPLTLLGDDPEANPPIELRLDAAVDPFVGALNLELQALPFARDPKLEATMQVRGIDMATLTEFFPPLEEKLDGHDMRDGQFQWKTRIELFPRRRDPLDFDVSLGFGLDLVVEDVELRTGPDAPVALGLDRLLVEATRIHPASGEVHINTLELDTPRAHVVKDAEGLHLGGLTVITPPVEEADPAEEVAELAEPEDAETREVSDDGSLEEKPEIRIDNLFVTGLDVSIFDSTVDPPMELPLTDIDVDVRGLSTHLPVNGESLRYSVALSSGRAAMPDGDSREIFSEILTRGDLRLSPSLQGSQYVQVTDLELTAFQGSARLAGVEIEAGSLDLATAMLMPGDGSVENDVRLEFTDLDLSEGENGLISRYLSLPAPLDVVTFLLRDEAGQIIIPMSFTMGADGLEARAILGAATETLGIVIAKAVTNSPFRVVGTFTDLASLIAGLEKDTDEGLQSFEVVFEPASTHISTMGRDRLKPLFELLAESETLGVRLRHELGARDVERLARRASPPPEECRVIVTTLRERKKELRKSRGVLREGMRAALGAYLKEPADKLHEKIRSVDRELAEIERAIDEISAHLHEGASHKADRRTRTTSLNLAYGRLDQILNLLLESDVDGMAGRIGVGRPRVREPEHEGGGRVIITLEKTINLD